MTRDEYYNKINEINYGPEREIVKDKMKRALRGQYFEQAIDQRTMSTQDLIERNFRFLARITGRKCTPKTVSEYMCYNAPPDFYDFFQEGYRFSSLKTLNMIAEFYGIPTRMLMFDELETYGDDFIKKYPGLIGQNRR